LYCLFICADFMSNKGYYYYYWLLSDCAAVDWCRPGGEFRPGSVSSGVTVTSSTDLGLSVCLSVCLSVELVHSVCLYSLPLFRSVVVGSQLSFPNCCCSAWWVIIKYSCKCHTLVIILIHCTGSPLLLLFPWQHSGHFSRPAQLDL